MAEQLLPQRRFRRHRPRIPRRFRLRPLPGLRRHKIPRLVVVLALALPHPRLVVHSSSTTSASSTPTYIPVCSSGAPEFSYVNNNGSTYEVECGHNIGGSDIGIPAGYTYKDFWGCIRACNAWNYQMGTTYCVAVTYSMSSNTCYAKKSVSGTNPNPVQAGFNGARLIYSGYPSITDNPASTAVSTTSPVTTTSSVAVNGGTTTTAVTTTAIITTTGAWRGSWRWQHNRYEFSIFFFEFCFFIQYHWRRK